MIFEIIQCLRDIAQDCVRLSRKCPHLPTARALEELAVHIMGKAKEVEDLYER
jgi:hypothetical protein